MPLQPAYLNNGDISSLNDEPKAPALAVKLPADLSFRQLRVAASVDVEQKVVGIIHLS